MTTHLGPVPEPPADADGRRSLGLRSLMDRTRENSQLTHGWDVELSCPTCGVIAVPDFGGWTPSHAMNFGNTPTIYADLGCPACGARQEDSAGKKLVELFAHVGVPPANKRLMEVFITVIVSFELSGTILILLGGWRELGGYLLRTPLILLVPAILWFNRQVASIRSRCECGSTAYKFMGLLGRSYCFRCSSCGRLLRLRD